jgi:hypothetical protein
MAPGSVSFAMIEDRGLRLEQRQHQPAAAERR